MTKRLFLAFAAAALIGLPVTAQTATEAPVYTFVATWDLKPGKTAEFWAYFEKTSQPILDALVQDGTLDEWARSSTMIHTEDMSEGIWLAAKSHSAIVKTLEKLTASPRPQAITDIIARHHDSFWRSLVFRVGSKRASTGYLMTQDEFVKPGRREEWLAVYKQFSQPVLEKLLTQGDILGYGIDREDFYTQSPGLRSSWILVANPEALDKVVAASAAASAARSRDENRMMGLAYADLVDATQTRSSLKRVANWVRK